MRVIKASFGIVSIWVLGILDPLDFLEHGRYPLFFIGRLRYINVLDFCRDTATVVLGGILNLFIIGAGVLLLLLLLKIIACFYNNKMDLMRIEQ